MRDSIPFLDLHGLTEQQAFLRVTHFIEQHHQRGTRTIGIIHGKGLRSTDGPVLKLAVIDWLEEHSQVLRHHVAPPHQGGDGARIVQLRFSTLTRS